MQSLPQPKHMTKICSSQWRVVGFVCKTSHFQGFFLEEHCWPSFISWFPVLLLSKLLPLSERPQAQAREMGCCTQGPLLRPGQCHRSLFLLLGFDTVSLPTPHQQGGASPTPHFLIPLQPSRVYNPGCQIERLLVFGLIPESFLNLTVRVISSQLNSFFRVPSHLYNS